MTFTIDRDHPFYFLEKVAPALDKAAADVPLVSYGRSSPTPLAAMSSGYGKKAQKYGNNTSERTVGHVGVYLFEHDVEGLRKQVEDLVSAKLKGTTAQEIGISSMVSTGKYHIPMIDFIGTPSNSRLGDLFDGLKYELGSPSFWIYNSGRSLHAYAETMISSKQFTTYLKQLSKFPDIVDTAWVAHSEAKGHMVLRWTAHTSHHTHTPKLIQKMKCV